MTQIFQATRENGIAVMDAFVPAMGQRYEDGRNYDLGAGNHTSVSMLSPYICRRLITEQEVIAAAVAAHGPDTPSKFIEEVIWRGYFKGWLERRPQVWNSYVAGLRSDLQTLDIDRRLRRDVANAEDGQTGLDYFDNWAQELVTTGYLHNHARMWFASIWIFSLGLPWRLGADFFYRHLLDGDAASNTLGWRWAAGLHTRGKPYPARAQNIATFTKGRFAPQRDDLVEVPKALDTTEPEGLPSVQPVRDIAAQSPDTATALLITDHDCMPADFDLGRFDICGVATLGCSHLRSPRSVSGAVIDFENAALADTAARHGGDVQQLLAHHPEELVAWARQTKASQIFTPFVARGPLLDWLDKAKPMLAAHDIVLCEQRREWDDTIWPHATAGFFKVRKQIPNILAKVGVGSKV